MTDPERSEGAVNHPERQSAPSLPPGLAEALIHLRVAASFLTVLPVAPRTLPEALAPARAYFPLVGLALGAGLAALEQGLRHAFPPLLSGAVLLIALVAATRALHLEGFIDCCDALWGGHTTERRLEILRDPHVGAFGVAGGACLVAVSWATLASIPTAERARVLLVFPCLSRWAMVAAMEAFPYARKEGLGLAFTRGRTAFQLPAALGTVVAAAALLAGWAGVCMLALATLVALGLGRWMARLLRGLTGDCYGAINEASSVAALLLAVAIARRVPDLFGSPLW